jgi:hypothetical protein
MIGLLPIASTVEVQLFSVLHSTTLWLSSHIKYHHRHHHHHRQHHHRHPESERHKVRGEHYTLVCSIHINVIIIISESVHNDRHIMEIIWENMWKNYTYTQNNKVFLLFIFHFVYFFFGKSKLVMTSVNFGFETRTTSKRPCATKRVTVRSSFRSCCCCVFFTVFLSFSS